MYKIKPPFNVNRAALATSIEATKDSNWIKKAIKYNTLWTKKIFTVLKEKKILTNKPTANFFLMNFDKTNMSSQKVFKKLASKRLILREMRQYKISNALRFTIGNEKANKLFIKSIKNIFK